MDYKKGACLGDINSITCNDIAGCIILKSSDRTVSILKHKNVWDFSIGDVTSGVVSFNGRTGVIYPILGDYTTSIVGEGSNLYFTTSRSRNSISASVPLHYNSSTGVLTIQDGAADGVTKGAVAFAASDFTTGSGIVSIDYVNTQTADNTRNGVLSSTDWIVFEAKEDTSNKVTTLVGANNTTYPTTLAVASAISGGGLGTVTSVSGVDNSTFSWSIANPTSAADITLTLLLVDGGSY